MKLHLKHFATHAEYEAYILGEEAIFPNVSICDNDAEGTIHYNATKVYEYVDLGLTSGTLWAKCNIGAGAETDYGDYFMWGSTTPDTENVCDWAHAPFNGGASSFDSAYFNAHKTEWLDENDVLKSEYDAAHVIMEGNWRMPTKADFEELLNETTSIWVTNYRGSGVNGMLFTSRANGNTLFFPAAGYRLGSSFYIRGVSGYVWSSLLYADNPVSAWRLYFGLDDCNMYYYDRYFGFSVRGVMKL